MGNWGLGDSVGGTPAGLALRDGAGQASEGSWLERVCTGSPD